ncbi:MAG: hypothetical protein HOC66_05530 [Flavobacteriales bacterium]|nr:hypothetical protein [Flavobacteriales bacterium]
MASNKIAVTDLEFDSIKTNLKNYLSAQSQFTDYDFTGSGMDVLLDILAYNTHYMGYYANMIGNEMFLDSSSLRESVVSHAKLLNIMPTSATAPTAKLNFTFTPSGSPTSLTITKNTKFTSTVDGVNYNFTTVKPTTLYPISGVYSVSDVEVKEGNLLTKSYTVNLADTSQRFLIPNANVDTTTINITVQNSANDSTVFTYADGNALDVTTITSTQRVYFIQEVEDQKYEIFFGDGAIGRQLADGNIIFVEYLTTSGTLANKASTFTAVGTVAGLTSGNYALTVGTTAVGGAAIESINSVKHNAPKLYQAQKRATTKDDYKAILLGEREDIESIAVYGGEDADPPVYGKVYIAIKPTGNAAYSSATKDDIKTSILKKTNVVTVIPELVDPIYYYIIVDTVVNYDPVTLLTTEDSLKATIDSTINSYFLSDLQKFDQKFRYSVLTKNIDNTSQAVRNSKTTIKYQLRITPATLATTSTYTLEYGNAITKGSLISTAFITSDGNTYTLIDDSLGSVKLVRSTYSNGTVTVDSPAVYMTLLDGSTNQGTIDYDTGKVVLNNFNPYTISDSSSNIKATVTPSVNNADISPIREQILTTDTNDAAGITVTMVAETII